MQVREQMLAEILDICEGETSLSIEPATFLGSRPSQSSGLLSEYVELSSRWKSDIFTRFFLRVNNIGGAMQPVESSAVSRTDYGFRKPGKCKGHSHKRHTCFGIVSLWPTD